MTRVRDTAGPAGGGAVPVPQRGEDTAPIPVRARHRARDEPAAPPRPGPGRHAARAPLVEPPTGPVHVVGSGHAVALDTGRATPPAPGPTAPPDPPTAPVSTTPPESTGRHRTVVPRGWHPAELAATVLVLAGLSWVVVTWPFRGDQAVYALIGHQITHGQALYTDLWDVKQPGVFLWYGLAGFGEIGMRLLDVAMAFAFGATVWALLRHRTETAWLRRWLPVLATAVLLLAAGPGDFGQLEMLCLVPATGAFALVAARPDRLPGWRRIALAGLCVGVVGLFKLLLAGVAGIALLVFLVARLRRGRVPAVLLVIGAAVVPILVSLGWLATQGAAGAALRVWLVDAVEMGAAPGSRSASRVAEGLGRYVLWMFPVAVLAAWQGATAWRRRDPLDLAMVAFALLDVLAIATQFAWWYQWYFASAPLVVLALRRLDTVRTRRAVVLVALACLPMLAHAASWTLPTVLDGGGFTAASRDRIDERVARYDTIRTEIAAADLGPQDSLYVLGDPLYNRLSGTPLTVRFDGWTYDLMDDAQWVEVSREIDTVRPDVVLVSTDAEDWVADRSPDVARVLAQDYTPYRTSDEGTWYRLH